MNRYTVTVGLSVILIALVTTYISHGLTERPTFTTTTVQSTNVVQGVSTNGTVQAAQSVDLSFQVGGTVGSVPVAVGDAVKAGQVLASLDSQSARASVDQARAAVASAQAAYEKVIDGATSAQTAVASAALTSAQTALANATATQKSSASQQATLVQNALSAMLNAGLAATPGSDNNDGITAAVTGTYTGTTQGAYSITIYSTGNGPEFQTKGLEQSFGLVKSVPVPLGTMGLYIQFSGVPSTTDAYTVNIPNTLAASYVAASSAYQAALQTQSQAATSAQAVVDSAQSAVAQAQASLNLMQTAARPEDVAAAQAVVAQAQASLESAESADSNTEIVAPFDGTIAEVDAKIGQTAAPGTPEVSVISRQMFQATTYVSQTDLGKVNVGDPAQVTLDAYGSGKVFSATVVTIDPSATTVGGIPGYKVTLQFNQSDALIKDGLAANITVTDATHTNVLAVPASAIFTQGNGNFVLEQGSNGAVTQHAVQLGITGLNGMVEVTSGLSAGDQVVYFGK
jgi:RND family efflux transporter MFP subunit